LSLIQFIKKWTHEGYPPDPVAGADLDAVETRFGFVFPEDYRQAVLAHGLPRPTLALLHSISEADLGIFDVSDFFAPKDITQLTDDWRSAGMPANLVAFADDCGGSLFCFKTDLDPAALDRATVWFWDHDNGVVTAVADSFTLWIERFCSVDYIEWDTEA
jgi:hypothetical protein